ncbi:hypothetical protein V502_00842 [Pseudogymnoascus sp. VKM F-4520 (FW-2644)]|nr:hypothetical protein V502_00842 [Pseudogymnoascus sp. VKM F-4520 (FW-2644)]
MYSPQQIANLKTLKSCQLCIICAKSTEAIVVKEKLFLDQKISGRYVAELPPGSIGQEFYLGSFTLNDGNRLSYYVTNTSRQSIQSFATQASALFTVLKPTYAIHVGVCAAISGKGFECEDVIFGEKALNYEEGKWGIENDKPIFLSDVKTLGVDGESMEGFIGQSERKDWKYGDYVSGCAVRMDAEHIFERVRKTQLCNVGALEMEASAFLQVCKYTGVAAFGVIKGVSDMGDHRKGLGHARHYKPALMKATDATKAFIKWKLEQIENQPPDRSKEPGVTIVPGYFDNCIGITIQKILATDYIVDVKGEKVKLSGFKVVLPKDNNVALFDNSTSSLEKIYKDHGMIEVTLPGVRVHCAIKA